ncbi:MAG: acyltransferase family protein, partial [Peptococcus niger]
MMQKKKVYYPALETMRIIAIAGVVAYHYYPQYLPGSFIGVDIFLALSGFLLARSLQAKYEEGVPLQYGAFLLKRVKRLWWPLFWMLLISVAFINLAAPSFLYNIRMTVLSGLTFTNNWWQIQQGSSYFADFVHPSAYTHLWYVALIMQVLVVLPLVMRGGQRLLGNPYRLAGLLGLLALASALAMGVLYVPSGDPSRVYYGTDTRVFAVLIGAVGGLLSEARFGDLLGRRWPVLRRLPMGDVLTLVGLGGLMILAFRLMDQSTFTYRGGLVLAALASTATFLGLTARSTVLGHLLSWKPLVALGNRTYAIYLWYYPVYAVSGTVPH